MTTPNASTEITMIWTYPNWGGAQIYFLSIVRNAPPGWKMRLAVPRGSNADVTQFFQQYGVDVGCLNSTYALRPAASISEKLKRQLQRVRSEAEVYFYARRNLAPGSIVHSESAPWQSWILLYLLSLTFNTVATVHNSIPKRNATWRGSIWKWRINFLLKTSSFQLFAANQDAVDSLRSYADEKYWPKITLTRASIDPSEIAEVRNAPLDRAAVLDRHGIPGDRFIVLCVGQFIDRKGRWVFLEAARQARTAGEDPFFVWVGPDAPSADDDERISSYGVGDHFKYIVSATLGPSRSDVLSFFRIADVFVLASYFEGLPISIIEALALGLPVISTNINAIPEAVKNLETGLLIEPGDVDGLTRAIEMYRSDPPFRRALAKAGQDFALEAFDERRATAVVFDRYLNGFGSRGGK